MNKTRNLLSLDNCDELEVRMKFNSNAFTGELLCNVRCLLNVTVFERGNIVSEVLLCKEITIHFEVLSKKKYATNGTFASGM